jgi:cyclohexanecarboxylate-CoA ligase
VTESFADAATLWDLVERRAAASPDTVLLIDEAGRTLTCREFRDRAERVAAGFAARSGSAPAPGSPGRPPTGSRRMLASFALARLGAVQNPILHLYRHKEVGYAITATDAEVVLVAGEWNGFDFGAMVHELTADLAADSARRSSTSSPSFPKPTPPGWAPLPASGDEVRWIYFTSGTTS